MSDPLPFQSAPEDGLVIIFDEPLRGPILRSNADERGEFKDAFSAMDWPFDEGHLELCVISFDRANLSHVALAEPGRRAVTAKRTVTFSHVIKCSPLPLSALKLHLDYPLEKVAVPASSPQGHRVKGDIWKAFFQLVRRLAPEIAKALIKLDAVRHAKSTNTASDAYEHFTLEADAIGTALDLSGMDRATVLRAAVPPGDGALPPFILTLDPRHQERGAKFKEVNALDNDARVSSMWVEQMEGINVVGTANFVKGERLLQVYNINNHPLETTLGVDLLYQNKTRGSFVLIQYKMMRHQADTSLLYRIDSQMESQLERMDKLAPAFSRTAARRLTAEAFYWKVCMPRVREAGSPELVKGWYFPRTWMRELISAPDAMGQRGGRRITEELASEGMSNTLFAELVRGAFIGSAGVASETLSSIIASGSTMGRSVIVAVEGELALPRM